MNAFKLRRRLNKLEGQLAWLREAAERAPESEARWLFLVLLYRVQTRRNLFQWLSLDFLQFLVPASFVDMLHTSRCRRLPEKIGVSSRAPKKRVNPRAQGPLPGEFFIFFISARHQAVCVSMASRYSRNR
jgi:hypothetical protein